MKHFSSKGRRQAASPRRRIRAHLRKKKQKMIVSQEESVQAQSSNAPLTLLHFLPVK